MRTPSRPPPALLPSAPSPSTDKGGGFTSLITTESLTLPVLLFSALAAMLWGALHALSPGHGKTIVAAYLVGSRASFKHAFLIGIPVTVTHTITVFALGLVTLLASQYILAEDLFPWIELTSGILVIGLGLWLLQSRLRALLGDTSWLKTRLPAFGLVSRLHHPHSHGHERADDKAERDHPHSHQHIPHGGDVNWKSLMTVGVTGGLLPCPSAVVIMLSAIALHRIGFGLFLVVAFSLGLAGTLTAVALLFLYGRKLLFRFTGHQHGAMSKVGEAAMRFFPVGSAAVISAAGLIIILKATSNF
ncbi:MAG: high frequency lysogenization protein HflD [SAR202 cluster bacterium]|nr:high frequency lysogenization protein HflD [SAR202 cluster bacterium]